MTSTQASAWDPPALISLKYFSEMTLEWDNYFIKWQLLKWLKPIINERSRLQTHTMKPVLFNQSWLVLRVCVCAYKVVIIQYFQSQAKELLFSHNNFRILFQTVCFTELLFFTTESCSKLRLYVYQVCFHLEILSMIDMREKDEMQLQSKVTTTDVTIMDW